jgi:hypothetical protein
VGVGCLNIQRTNEFIACFEGQPHFGPRGGQQRVEVVDFALSDVVDHDRLAGSQGLADDGGRAYGQTVTAGFELFPCFARRLP